MLISHILFQSLILTLVIINMYPIKIIKNFITEHEKNILNSWSIENYKKPFFSDPKMNLDKSQTRFTTRHSHNRNPNYVNYKIKYPIEVYNIQKRLFVELNLDYRSLLPWPGFTDGVVNTIAFPPGSCIKHKDPVYYSDTYTLHCNLITKKAKSGGHTYIENKLYDIEEQDLLMYVTSHLEHEATEIGGDIPRILWVYGFCLEDLEVKSIFGNLVEFPQKIKFTYN